MKWPSCRQHRTCLWEGSSCANGLHARRLKRTRKSSPRCECGGMVCVLPRVGQTPAAPCDPDGNKQYLAVKLMDGSYFSNSLNWKDSSAAAPVGLFTSSSWTIFNCLSRHYEAYKKKINDGWQNIFPRFHWTKREMFSTRIPKRVSQTAAETPCKITA